MGIRALLPAIVLLTACTTAGVPNAAPGSSTPAEGPLPTTPPSAPVAPSGVVRVAYPEEPSAWHPAFTDEPAATDLGVVWGLPLYRIDDHGQLRPGLATDVTVRHGDPWEVEVSLADGTWSDGRPVTAGDVVATLGALRGELGPELEALIEAVAVDDRTVVLRFSRPYGRWPYLLAGGRSVLPAHVLADGGLDRFRDGVPISGGPFHLESHEPGLRATFVANPRSPLGPPRAERLEAYFTPSFETAMGLVDEDRVDVALGYLALNPVERAEVVSGAHAAAPIGGTWLSVRWEEGAFADVDARRIARDAVDITELVDGLLGSAGAVQTSLLPGAEGPWVPDRQPVGDLDDVTLDLLVPGEHEATGFTSRVLQRDLRGVGAEVSLVGVQADRIGDRAPVPTDGSIVIHRDTERPPLVAAVPPGATPEVIEQLHAADAAGSVTAEAVHDAQGTLFDEAWRFPLYRIGVAHVWDEALDGLTPSAWPGLAFWDVASWHWGSGPPPQRDPMDAAG